MTIFGLDFSHYDAVPSGSRVVSEGFKFMTHKAGGDSNDAELGAWWSALKPYRDQVLLGAYWVLYPGSASSRADAFIARLDDQCPGWRDGPFILQLDCEKWNGDSSTVPSKADIKACCDRLVARMPKLWPVVYAPKWVYGDSLTGLAYPLWASAYVTGIGTASGLYPGDGSSRWDAYSGKVPAILQFTSSATALGQSTCDANAFRGTLDQMTALLAPGWAEDMDLTDQNLTDIANAVWNHMELDPDSTTTPQGSGRMGGWARMDNSRRNAQHAETMGVLNPMATAVGKVLANVAADDGEAQEIMDAIQAAQQATADAVVTSLVGRSDDEVAAALVAALGAERAAAVAARMTGGGAPAA
jgi:hypothetical protein